MENNQSEQAKRIIFIYKKLLAGHVITTKELQEEISDQMGTISIRTIQRDLRLLQDCCQEVEQIKIKREVKWRIPKELRIPKNFAKIKADELISFYVLKAHLKTFSGTVIESEVLELEKKLEELAPGEVYSDESLYWDQNLGQFDYSMFDNILRKVIKCIISRKWLSVTYRSIQKGAEKTFDAMFYKIFTYNGFLYVGTYVPKYQHFIALALHRIDSIAELQNQSATAPIFDFKNFTENRFGVYTSSLRFVKLKIKKEYSKYFINRKWHSSQKEYFEPDSSMIIEMKVPLVPDFVSWILSWSDAITVLKPDDLINMVLERIKKVHENYQFIVQKK